MSETSIPSDVQLLCPRCGQATVGRHLTDAIQRLVDHAIEAHDPASPVLEAPALLYAGTDGVRYLLDSDQPMPRFVSRRERSIALALLTFAIARLETDEQPT